MKLLKPVFLFWERFCVYREDRKAKLCKSSLQIVSFMFAEYIAAALRRAKYDALENGSFMATVEGLPGVIATGKTIEECREDLIEVIEEWITIRLQRGLNIPAFQ
jgi:predicted RNase H-like HicB family nuclease